MTVAIRVCFIKIFTYSIIRCIYVKLSFWPLLQTIIQTDSQTFVIVICKADAKSIRHFKCSIPILTDSWASLRRYCIIIIQFMLRRIYCSDSGWMFFVKFLRILQSKIQFIIRHWHSILPNVRISRSGIRIKLRQRAGYISPKIRSIHTNRQVFQDFYTRTNIQLM